MDLIKNPSAVWRGVALCLGIALPAWFLGKQFEVVGGPVFAILIGMVLALVLRGRSTASFGAGVKFTSKKVLQYAVILLGFGLNLGQIAQVGATSLPIIVSTIATSLVIAFVLSRVLNIPGKIATLVGVGSSICGGSAIAATAPVIDADDEEIAPGHQRDLLVQHRRPRSCSPRLAWRSALPTRASVSLRARR